MLQGHLRYPAAGNALPGPWAKLFAKVKRKGFLTLGIEVMISPEIKTLSTQPKSCLTLLSLPPLQNRGEVFVGSSETLEVLTV